MDNGRLLHEAQLIATEFKFYMVKGNLEHLYGYIYQSPDGETKYPLEIKYTTDFPDSPPDFIFPQPIPKVPDEIELESLNNWTSESHVIDAVRELAALIKTYVEKPPEEVVKQEIPPKSVIPDEKAPLADPEPDYITPVMDETLSVSHEAEQSDQYLTPDPTQYQYEQDEYINPDDLPQWTDEDDSLVETAEPQTEEHYITPDPSPISEKIPEFEQMATPNVDSDPDIQVSTEAALIQQEYAIDYVGNEMGVVEVYLTITIEQTFIIRIDFSSYPKRPIVTVQENLQKVLGDVNSTLDLLKNWNERNPKHVVELIREIEGKLWFLSDIEQEAKMVNGEYKTEMVDGLISNLRVGLFTYGFKEYTLNLDIAKYPAEPKIQFSSELQQVLPFPPEDLMAYKNWKRKESHVVDILREISWLVDKASRISFEVDLLKGGVKRVEYNKTSDNFLIELSGQLKTKDLKFEFEVHIQDEYPITAPEFKLLSELEENEEIQEKITKQIDSFTAQWHPFNYLIDLFNQISKTIFAESIISCVICHKLDCPECGMKISASSGESHEQCNTQCPSCERQYHEHCWNQTIISFGKCGFCLRPPPEHMKPKI